MKGTNVHYARDIGSCISGEAIVHCMLLLWTGDLPAQCEEGKFINCGIFPSRRHQLRGTNISGGSTHYIVIDFLFHLVIWKRKYLKCQKLKMKIEPRFEQH